MIYQLTPEAPKGKKNVRTKAEFIKKIQSSTSESKEMKFRVQKKDSSKYEDGEAKKILSEKHRTSLSSSVKSPFVCEDFETHSADDSIIYRRHSSSSYSSTCMSPRRLSDVDSGGTQYTARTALIVEKGNKISDDNNKQTSDTFMADPINITNSEIINRDDCLSIKEKLNSKLSLALNKRKRENSNNDKPPKQKKKGPRYNIEVLKEFEQALICVDGRKDISVTLVTSQCGMLCSSLDFRPLLEDDEKKRATNACEIADSVRLSVYINICTAWFDIKTQNDAIGLVGLHDLDTLYAFMIKNQLQNVQLVLRNCQDNFTISNLLKKHISYQLNTSCKFDSAHLEASLRTMNECFRK
ncbi:unnamed protein product [Parnassius apollo]|uniref:(apollo) hypothetical protein n=1 Tax=Parnassius apollo TaxID=110799 RepID=A0A8S3WPS0_PARAO|nr:unnamed protein product [Parnassius apollo]